MAALHPPLTRRAYIAGHAYHRGGNDLYSGIIAADGAVSPQSGPRLARLGAGGRPDRPRLRPRVAPRLLARPVGAMALGPLRPELALVLISHANPAPTVRLSPSPRLRGEGRGEGLFFALGRECLKNSVHILSDFFAPDADHAITEGA